MCLCIYLVLNSQFDFIVLLTSNIYYQYSPKVVFITCYRVIIYFYKWATRGYDT